MQDRTEVLTKPPRRRRVIDASHVATGTITALLATALVYLSNWVPQINDLSFNNSTLSGVHFTGHGQLPSLELLEQAFWKRLSDLETAEWRTGHSLVGPHRDDWTFFLGSQILKGHGSQGEVRSALLALKLAEIELFRNETGHRFPTGTHFHQAIQTTPSRPRRSSAPKTAWCAPARRTSWRDSASSP